MVGQASEIVPEWAGWMGALVILGMSVKPIWSTIKARFKPAGPHENIMPEPQKKPAEALPAVSDCSPT